jgi:hypothetical protein
MLSISDIKLEYSSILIHLLLRIATVYPFYVKSSLSRQLLVTTQKVIINLKEVQAYPLCDIAKYFDEPATLLVYC